MTEEKFDYLTTRQVSELQKVTIGRVCQWILEGSLPAKRFGHAWMIKRSDAENYKRRPITGRPRKNENV